MISCPVSVFSSYPIVPQKFFLHGSLYTDIQVNQTKAVEGRNLFQTILNLFLLGPKRFFGRS